MCGIAGSFEYRGGAPADPGILEAQLVALRHRGPESNGVWRGASAALGHRRLSIADLSTGGLQPLRNEDGSTIAVVNGEFYGAAEVRACLQRGGHAFRGESDSEVLVHLWEEQGAGALERLNGMFALALFDTSARVLFLARDRMGKKPLYWHDDGRRIAFASEAKALLLDPGIPREVEAPAVVEALTYRYISSPRSIWKAVQKLPPGHFLRCDASGPRVERYWSAISEPIESMRPGDAIEELRRLTEDAVRTRLEADVPIGALLSGGIDSSCVAAVMTAQRGPSIPTFCLGVEGEVGGDLEFARLVARHLGAEHHEYTIGPGALALLPRLVWGLDEPLFDPSMLPTYLVAQLARQRVTVALSGDGGDELFGGYETYLKAVRHAAADWVPHGWRRRAASAARALPFAGSSWDRLRQWDQGILPRHLTNMSLFHPAELDRILAPGFAPPLGPTETRSPLQGSPSIGTRDQASFAALLDYDARTYLADDVLAKVDRMSMLNSLEVRAPFLDRRVVEFAGRLPFSLKVRRGVTKWVLRESARPLLPEAVLSRRKRGFGLPLQRWLDRGLRTLARETLLDGPATRRGWLSPKGVADLLHPDHPRPGRSAHQLFAVLCLELWARTFLDRPREDLHFPMDAEFDLHPAVAATAVA